MNLLKSAVRLVKRRPSALFFLSTVTLIFAVIDSYNPVFPILFGLGSMHEGDAFGSLVSFLQFMMDPDIIPSLALFILAFSVVGAAVASLVFSGYFYVVSNAFAGRKKVKGEFATGLRKHFFRMFSISFRVLLIGFILAIFMLVASVPAIVITNAAKITRPELLAAAVLVDILTAGVLFFGFMFFRTYALFWYPAAIDHAKRSFSIGKKTVDANFWSITGRFIVFDIVFIAVQFLFAAIDHQLAVIIVKWLFGTGFLLFFTTYIFAAFRIYSAEIQD